MEVEAVLRRAHSALSRGTRYGLGRGGMNPSSSTPAKDGRCDCSGFVAWALGMSRKTSERFYVQQNGGWIETSAVWADIGRSVGIFEPIGYMRPGAVIVYPDRSGNEGHIGIIIGEDRVIHCSLGNDRSGDAIQETSAEVFRRNSETRLGWLIDLH